MKEVKLNTQFCPTCREHFTTQAVCPMCGNAPPKRAKSRKKGSVGIMQKAHSAMTPQKVKRGTWAYMNMTFDSKPEAYRYGYLIDLQSRGVIRNLEIQPTYTLRDSYQLSGKWYTRTKAGKPRTISAEIYTPDFQYTYDGTLIIEDVKGLKKGKPYSKPMSNLKQYQLQWRYADRDDVLFMLVCQVRNGWQYFQQSHGYPELVISYDLEQVA